MQRCISRAGSVRIRSACVFQARNSSERAVKRIQFDKHNEAGEPNGSNQNEPRDVQHTGPPKPIPFRSFLGDWQKEQSLTGDSPLKAADGKQAPGLGGSGIQAETGLEEDDEFKDLPDQTGDFEREDPSGWRTNFSPGTIANAWDMLGGHSLVFVIGTPHKISRPFVMTATGKTILISRIALMWADNHIIYPSLLKQIQREIPDLSTIGALADTDLGPTISEKTRSKVRTLLREKENLVQKAFSKHLHAFSTIYTRWSSPVQLQIRTLQEIAKDLDLVDPKSDSAPWFLCALNRALHSEMPRIRPMGQNQAAWNKFIFLPSKNYAAIVQVQGWIEEYKRLTLATADTSEPNTVAKAQSALEKSPITQFIAWARGVIRKSRQTRDWIEACPGPYKAGNLELNETLRVDPDEKTGLVWVETIPGKMKNVIIFLWDCVLHRQNTRFRNSKQFTSAVNLIHDLGLYSKYDEEEILVMLKELGTISPWFLPKEPHSQLLPASRLSPSSSSNIARDVNIVPGHPLETHKSSLYVDQMADIRHDWRGLDVYCIDDPSTQLVEDGVSLERIPHSDNVWLHVHCASPAGFIPPSDKLAREAVKRVTDWKLSGYMRRMFPPSFNDRFMIQNGSPTITISVEVTPDGTVVDSKVRAAKVNNVLYMSERQIRRALGEPEPVQKTFSIQIGKEFSPKLRDLKDIDSLSQHQLADLRKLHQMAMILNRRQKTRDFQRGSPETPNALARFGETAMGKDRLSSFWSIFYSRDVSINYTCSHRDPEIPRPQGIVEALMILANITAGDWCAQRNIPVPFVSHSPANGQERATQRDLIESVFRPINNMLETAPRGVYSNIFLKLNSRTTQTYPRESFTIGADTYVRVTSALRRATDLFAHWQIAAALRIEAKEDRTFLPEDLAKLPFDKDSMQREIDTISNTSALISKTEYFWSKTWEYFALGQSFYHKLASLPEVFPVELAEKSAAGTRYSLAFSCLDFGQAARVDTGDVDLYNSAFIGQIWLARIVKVRSTVPLLEIELIRKVRDPIFRRHASQEDCDLLDNFEELTPEVHEAVARVCGAVKDKPHLPLEDCL